MSRSRMVNKYGSAKIRRRKKSKVEIPPGGWRCPDHNTMLKYSKSKNYWYCEDKDCSVIKLQNQTSTPADKETRRLRFELHGSFDALWNTARERSSLYREMGVFMGLSRDEAHIGMFSAEQCKTAMAFVDIKRKMIDGQKER